MQRYTITKISACLLLSGLALFADSPAVSVSAVVESSLESSAGQIRQFAFDGDPNTFLASARNAGSGDHFTLRFDKPVAVKSIVVTTGRPDGTDQLDKGVLQFSPEG